MPLGRVAGLCGHPRRPHRRAGRRTGKWPLAGGGKPPQIADLSRCGMTGQRHGCTFAASCARLGSYPKSAHRREAATAGRALEVDCIQSPPAHGQSDALEPAVKGFAN